MDAQSQNSLNGVKGKAAALSQVCGWWGPLVSKVEPVAAVPALVVFQETCSSSSQRL